MIRIILAAGIILGFTGAFLAQGQDPPVANPGKKEIPKITFKNLSPPYEDYAYFQDIEKYVFQYNETSFSLINAWWLAEASTLVYSGEGFVRSRFHKAGLPEVRFFDKQSTQCYVVNNDKFAIVAFRGSEIWKKNEKFDLKKVIADLMADVDIRLTDWQNGGKVHRGFKEALGEVWPDLLPHIRELHEKGCKIWITGHSLGAALATLCAERCGNVQGVYTFGSPRVGNGDFKENYGLKLYRIVNNDDIVPRVPPQGAYAHVGELKFIDGDGTIRDKMIENERPINLAGNETYDQSNFDQPGGNSFKGFVPAGFRDHVPVLYAIRLWNSLIESRP